MSLADDVVDTVELMSRAFIVIAAITLSQLLITQVVSNVPIVIVCLMGALMFYGQRHQAWAPLTRFTSDFTSYYEVVPDDDVDEED